MCAFLLRWLVPVLLSNKSDLLHAELCKNTLGRHKPATLKSIGSSQDFMRKEGILTQVVGDCGGITCLLFENLKKTPYSK